MSTNGETKWSKYFKGRDVTTRIKSSVPVFLQEAGGSSIQLQPGEEIFVPATTIYNPSYYVETQGRKGLIPQRFIAKPVEHVESLGINASLLVGAGQDATIDGIPTKLFNGGQSLIDSISQGLSEGINNDGRSDYYNHIAGCFRGSAHCISWPSSMGNNVRNQLGKYLGELIHGALLMDGQFQSFTGLPFREAPVKFAVPTSSNHSGVDSFLIFANAYVKPVSSKYGAGARASFFSNLLPQALQTDLSNSALKQVCASAIAANVSFSMLESKRGSKQVLYEYCIRNILGLANVSNCYGVFLDVKTNLSNVAALSRESRMVLDHSKGVCSNNCITDQLPYSLTAIYNRAASAKLNACHQSISQIKEILLGKDMIQMHLCNTTWCTEGKVKYDCIQSSNCEVRFTGNKGVVGDLDSQHGMINYVIGVPRDKSAEL